MNDLTQQSPEAQHLVKLLSEYVQVSVNTADSLERVCESLEKVYDGSQLKEVKLLVSSMHGEVIKLVAINDFFRDELRKDKDLDAEREKREHELKLLQLKQRNHTFRELAAWILGAGGLVAILIKEFMK